MTAPNGGAGSRTRPHRERQQRRAAIHFQTEPRTRWRVRRSRTRCVTNATLAGNSHAVASTDLRVLDPHVAPVRPANDRPFADHVHLDRGTRLGAALQHDGRWYNALKAAHGNASSTSGAGCSCWRARASAARPVGGTTGAGVTERTTIPAPWCSTTAGCTRWCSPTAAVLWGRQAQCVAVAVCARAHLSAPKPRDLNVARAERGGRGGPGRLRKKDVNTTICEQRLMPL